MGDRFISFRYELELWGFTALFVIKIKGEDEMLEAWNLSDLGPGLVRIFLQKIIISGG